MSNKFSEEEKLAFAKAMYEKYPNNFELIHHLGDSIVKNMEHIDENIALLKEIHKKIIDECTDEEYRRASIHRMCYVATDDELEDLIGKSELNWQEAIAIGELREERYELQGRYDELRRERRATDLLIFMQYLGRRNMDYFGKRETQTYMQNFYEPARTAAWEKHKLRMLEQFDGACDKPNGVSDAWCGCYAEFTLKAAGALIGSGETDEGFALLEKAFPLYERWNAIPKETLMDVGNHAVFGKLTINKIGFSKYVTKIHFEDGHKVWTPYLWLFWQLPNDISRAMTEWPWFDDVKEDTRYVALLARAKEMADGK
ncbi:MAG: hypothetical protein IJW21_09510 [Clostridia bacterium]|nr:hypothetical protein [Clostridia bacterium]